MTGHGAQVVDAIARLRVALEQTATALATADLDLLLRSEGAVELALRAMPAPADLDAEARAAALDEVTRARILLQRCRRHGDVLLDVVRLTFEAQGRASGYGPRDVPVVPYGRSLDARG